MQRRLKSSARNTSSVRKITECSLSGKTTRKKRRKDSRQLVPQLKSMEGLVKTSAAEETQMGGRQLEDREAAEEEQLLAELRAMHNQNQAPNKTKTRGTRTREVSITIVERKGNPPSTSCSTTTSTGDTLGHSWSTK